MSGNLVRVNSWAMLLLIHRLFQMLMSIEKSTPIPIINMHEQEESGLCPFKFKAGSPSSTTRIHVYNRWTSSQFKLFFIKITLTILQEILCSRCWPQFTCTVDHKCNQIKYMCYLVIHVYIHVPLCMLNCEYLDIFLDLLHYKDWGT